LTVSGSPQIRHIAKDILLLRTLTISNKQTLSKH